MEPLQQLLGDDKFMSDLFKTMGHPLTLPFVNRKQEVIDLSLSLILNSLNAALGTTDNQSYFLPFLPQMFGAGKTTIGAHLLTQAVKHRAELLQELGKVYLPVLSPLLEQTLAAHPQDQQGRIRSEIRTQLMTEQLDKYLGATYVHISMDDLPEYDNEHTTFTKALRMCMQGAFRNCNIIPHDTSGIDTTSIRTFVSDWTRGHHVLIHFDDVGSLLNPEKYGGYFAAVDNEPKWEMRRIYKFWDTIHHLNKMERSLSCIL